MLFSKSTNSVPLSVFGDLQRCGFHTFECFRGLRRSKIGLSKFRNDFNERKIASVKIPVRGYDFFVTLNRIHRRMRGRRSRSPPANNCTRGLHNRRPWASHTRGTHRSLPRPCCSNRHISAARRAPPSVCPSSFPPGVLGL